MLNKLMAFTTDLLNIVSWEEAPKATVTEALLYALVGFVTVFLGISFLIFVVWLVGKVMAGVEGKKTKQTEIPAVNVEESKSTTDEEEISEETIAVITAAIMAYYVKENRKCEFTVKRIKRI